MSAETDLLTPLRRYWGYSTFRPLQERIVRSLLAGHDTCVVMPTGGGKSLCYQLPAVVSGGTAVVISPLIALMQDQAAQLAQMGIPAAVLNSTLSEGEQSKVMKQARDGAYRLLYVSPERIARGDTLGWLQQVPITFFAIDEAHCISEWGHEFRPEYRQLSKLRTKFPDRPIAAFTASATRHVRHDILAQLQLRSPDKYIASFYRSNLRYLVRECEGLEQMELLVKALRSYSGSNVIVYSPTINRVEETVDFLGDHDIAAVGYHGKMGSDDRRRNQERWMSDEVRVLVGTIAFGLGINKAAVRAVIHLSLPKSIEQYYQEAGRAGRDGASADCALLWQKRDAGLLGFFANQITDAAERERAWERYRIIREFVESKRCRHRQICGHFGEAAKWETCGACDVCGSVTEWMTAPVRGLISVGKESRVQGVAAGTSVDVDLSEYLREWRRTTAKEQGVPAFVVLHDTTLEEICRRRPASIAELLGITGIGERKAEVYGKGILAALERYGSGARASAAPEKITMPALETTRLLMAGNSFEDIAKIRGRQLSTVVNAVANLVERGDLEFEEAWIDRNKLAVIEAACAKVGSTA
jgi:ATP-dependent DNA helicase RecQ